jgi:ubiquinone biosynthesis protein
MGLVKGHLVGISLRPEHLKRYRDIAWLLMKYGRPDLIKHAGLEEAIKGESLPDATSAPQAEALTQDLERLGPTFVKLGQLLSTRPDILPMPYVKALTRLQDRVEPVPFEEIERIVNAELGVRLSKAFMEFDPVPMAAASLGQVHRARMRDGRLVAVKVQRAGIRERVAEDLDALVEIAEFLDNHTQMGERYEFGRMLEEFRKSFVREFDYRLEAGNLLTLHRNLREFDKIVVPLPVEDYTTSRVLTMEYVSGRKITSVSPLARLEIDGEELANQLFAAYLQQVLINGVFHADPHPGNLFLTDDGRVALLDLGMVGRITPALQDKLLYLLHAVSEGRALDAANIATRMGEKTEDYDASCFRREISDLVAKSQNLTIERMETGAILLEFARVSGECGLRLPTELTMLAKTLLNLDQVGKALYPHFDPAAAIRKNAAGIIQQRMIKSISFRSLMGNLLELKGFLGDLPGKLGSILEKIENNELSVKVDTIDEKRLMGGLQKIANRITLGLILAALIMGASRLVTVPTSFKILGYPGLAIIFFLAAAAGGLVLILIILFYDERPPKK